MLPRRALPWLAAPALAQPAWPDRPLRLLVPFAPGGVTDTIARLSADWLAPRLGQPVVVENRSGANGAIAVEAVVRARPDGYTLLTASASQMVMLPALARLPFDTMRDLAPIAIIGANPQVLAVSARSGITDVAGFLARVRAADGQLAYGTSGHGTSTHLSMALLLGRAGLSAVQVPYRAGPPAVQAILSGDVVAYFGNPIDVMAFHGGPLIRVLAVAGQERMAVLPGVPTFDEQGFAGLRAGTWNGIAAPAGTPPAIIDRLAAILGEACGDAAFSAALLRVGTVPVCSSPAQFQMTMAVDAPQWAEIVRRAGITLE